MMGARREKNFFCVFSHDNIGRTREAYRLLIVKVSGAVKEGINIDFCSRKVKKYLPSIYERKIAERKQK